MKRRKKSDFQSNTYKKYCIYKIRVKIKINGRINNDNDEQNIEQKVANFILQLAEAIYG